MTFSYSISKYQLDSFKAHAVVLAETLKIFDPVASPIKGRKRVDLLAQACGYKGHTDLIYRAFGGSCEESLALFSPMYGQEVARAYASMSGVRPELVLAAIVKAAVVLYTADNEMEFHWKVKDMLTLPEESQMLISPPVTRPKPVTQINPTLLEQMRLVRESHISQLVESSTMRQTRVFQDSPVMQSVRMFQDSPAMQSIRMFQDSPAMQSIRQISESPVMRQMQQLHESPAMKVLRDAAALSDKLFPASLRKFNLNKW